MREVDRVAVEETGPNLYQMMENAGRGLASVVLGPNGRSGPIVVLAGTGGNGGGGICAARHLVNRGLDVELVLVDDARLGEVPAFQLELFRHAGGHITQGEPQREPAVVIDALVGYSLSGAPTGRVLDLIDWVATEPAWVVSLDMPSGLDATTGDAPGARVEPELIFTLALPKRGLVAESADLILGDLGIPAETYRRAGVSLAAPPFSSGFTVPITAG